jgi:UDP-N-acetylmuramoyl-tripeptide--D-alanyl-D-alanine ligase
MFDLSTIADIIAPRQTIAPQSYAHEFARISTDTRSLQRGDVFVALKGERYDANLFLREAEKQGAGLIIASSLPDTAAFSVPVMLVDDTLVAYAKLAGFVRRKCQAFVLGITGSYGKTTTKEMVAFLFSKHGKTHASAANENNAVGVPKTLLGIDSDTKYAVIEMGTNVCGEIAFEAECAYPDCAIVTGIAEVHTETFKDKRGVLEEKLSLFTQAPFAVAVLNHDDALLRTAKVGRKQVFFGMDPSCAVSFHVVSKGHCHVTVKINKKYELVLNTYASFYASNAAAAIAAAMTAGIPIADAVHALEGFVFPKMRTELTEANGIKFFNDAYNSNPFALACSLDEFREVESARKIVVIGDMLELGSLEKKKHAEVFEVAADYPAELVLLVGPRLAAAYTAGKASPRVMCTETAAEASAVLKTFVRPGDAILLKGSRGIGLETIIDQLTA